MAGQFTTISFGEEEDEDPKLLSSPSIDLDPVSTPPFLDWLDVSLEISPPGEVESCIPFETLTAAVDANSLSRKLDEI
jgi:hypothetical protein